MNRLSQFATLRFRVLLHGTNFALEMDGTIQLCNFYTTRFVDGHDVSSAEANAISKVLGEFERLGVRNSAEKPPALFTVEINQVNWMRARFRQPKGYTFYTSD